MSSGCIASAQCSRLRDGSSNAIKLMFLECTLLASQARRERGGSRRNDVIEDIRKTKRGRGQGMTEYIIIVALIAVAAIGVVTVFGDNIRKLFGASAQALAGSQNVQNRGDSSENANLEQKTMKTFGRNK